MVFPGMGIFFKGLKWRPVSVIPVRHMSSTVVMSFGDGSHGALGLPASLTGVGGDAYEPTVVPGLPSDIISVSAGHYHSLAVDARGKLWAWGRDHEAQLGRGFPSPRDTWHEAKPVIGVDQVKVRAASASGVVSAAIGDDGSLWVWGTSKRGQLGLGKDITEAVIPSRVEALVAEKIAKVAFGWGHVLACSEDGKLFGWGYHADGRLGNIGEGLERSALDSSIAPLGNDPQLVRSAREVAEKLVLEGMKKENNMPIIWEPRLVEEFYSVEVIDAVCGLDHSLVLCRDGSLLSSGSNTYGQLGRVKQDLGFFPVDISFHPVSVAAGLGHSLAIYRTDGAGTKLVSWGWNQTSQLGRQGPESVPLEVDGLAGEELFSVSGGRVHTIALTSKGEMWVWGCGRNGRLGLGSSADEPEPFPLDISEDNNVLQAVAGFDHNLILAAD